MGAVIPSPTLCPAIQFCREIIVGALVLVHSPAEINAALCRQRCPPAWISLPMLEGNSTLLLCRWDREMTKGGFPCTLPSLARPPDKAILVTC